MNAMIAQLCDPPRLDVEPSRPACPSREELVCQRPRRIGRRTVVGDRGILQLHGYIPVDTGKPFHITTAHVDGGMINPAVECQLWGVSKCLFSLKGVSLKLQNRGGLGAVGGGSTRQLPDQQSVGCFKTIHLHQCRQQK